MLQGLLFANYSKRFLGSVKYISCEIAGELKIVGLPNKILCFGAFLLNTKIFFLLILFSVNKTFNERAFVFD